MSGRFSPVTRYCGYKVNRKEFEWRFRHTISTPFVQTNWNKEYWQRRTRHLKSEGVWGVAPENFWWPRPSDAQKMRETPFLVIFFIPCTLWYRLFNRFDENVPIMAANRDPYSQRHVQAEITRDIEMTGSEGKTSGKFLKICILLWLKMPLPAVFKHFLETKTLLPILEKTILSFLFKNLRDHFLTDMPDRPIPPPINFITFLCESRGPTFWKVGGPDPPIPPLGYATEYWSG